MDQFGYFMVDQVKPFMIIFFTGELKGLHFLEGDLTLVYPDNTVTHQQGTRINTKYYFSRLLQTALYFYMKRKTGPFKPKSKK